MSGNTASMTTPLISTMRPVLAAVAVVPSSGMGLLDTGSKRRAWPRRAGRVYRSPTESLLGSGVTAAILAARDVENDQARRSRRCNPRRGVRDSRRRGGARFRPGDGDPGGVRRDRVE